MSRIGLMPITIPAGVEVKIGENNIVSVKGKNGTLEQNLPKAMTITMEDGVINVARPDDKKEHRELHGLTRTLINNMITGVMDVFKKELIVEGVGYRANVQGKELVMTLGYSHPVNMNFPEGITVEIPQPNHIVVSGADKQRVGQFAAEIREKRLPEPYKGKGIRYVDEFILRKEGKAGKASS